MPENQTKDIRGKQEEVSVLRNKVNYLHKTKEEWFKRKEDLKKQLNELISKIKNIKSQTDKKSIELKEAKTERDKFNKKVKDLISNLKEAKTERDKVLKNSKVSLTPDKIIQKIKQLEESVETEADYKKEKKLMEEIKKLKKLLEESKGVSQVFEKANSLSRETRESKRVADEFHRKVQEIAKNSDYKEFMELSREIEGLKKKQEEAFQKFIDSKTEFSNCNNELKKKQEELDKINLSERDNKKFRDVQKTNRQKEVLEKKSKQIEEKLKTKKKLTTEDIIAFQGSSE